MLPSGRVAQLTVLGTSAAWPERGRAASGYLLESGGHRLVLDLGYATLPRLLALCPADAVDAVVVTHAHADHCVDVHGLYRARTLPDPPSAPLPLFASSDVLDRIGPLEGPRGVALMRERCQFTEIGPDQTFEIGPFRVRTLALPHFVPNLGVRVEVEGRSLAYTGDTGPSPKILELARRADVFLCEATFQGTRPVTPERFLLTATEAGQFARDAEVGQLVLTHFWPGDDRARSGTEAAAALGRAPVLADEGLSLTL